jgi:Leucine-rich repeat (LRR) protein
MFVLEYLSLKENQLVSSLPLEIQTLTKLKELTIAKNKLTGQLQLPIATKLGEANT